MAQDTVLARSKEDKVEEKKDFDEYSVALDKVLTEALEIATQNIDKGNFKKEYQTVPDSICIVKVGINFGLSFTKEFPHLVIRRSAPSETYIDVYSLNEGKFERVVSHVQSCMTYVNDTIQDINGDRLNDFVVNWYGSAGCCLKGFSEVYLMRNDKKTFSSDFQFINPTFSPKEKMIRGVCYGHPGQTAMYKYKWNGEAIDTLEYVYFETNTTGEHTGKVIVSKYREYSDSTKTVKRLNSVPNEYKKIEGYDWFMGTDYYDK